jgi:hypothetical protein
MITKYAVTVHGDTRDQVAASMLIEACKHFRVDFRLVARLIHAIKPAHLTTGQDKVS